MLRVQSLGILVVLLACSDDPAGPGVITVDPGAAPSGAAAAAADGWRARADYHTTLWSPASASITDPSTLRTTVYVIGGNSKTFDGASGRIISAVKAYNVTTNTWVAKAPVPVRVMASNGAVEINGKIYLSGGWSRRWDPIRGVWGGMLLQSLYVYDIATNTWTRGSDMPFVTAGGVSAGYQGLLYVATTCYDESCQDRDLGALWRYNPGTDRWMLLGSTPHNPEKAGGGVIGGKFYLVTTAGADVYLDIYDLATNTWSIGPRPPYICAAAYTTLRGKLYLVGCGDLPDDGHILVFDPKTGLWDQAPAPTLSTTGSFRTLSRVVVNGVPGLELIGGAEPGNNWQYQP